MEGLSGAVSEENFCTAYREHAHSFVGATVEGVRIGYDAMHGSGRGVTDRILETAGVEIDRFRCTRDVPFGGFPPEPRPDHAEELFAKVESRSVDLGLINDGDADRLGVVTSERGFVDPNVLLAVIYKYLLESGPNSAGVVRAVSTSSFVDRVAREGGRDIHETAVGFNWVARSMAENAALAGGERSGGCGIGTHLHNKDGVILALLLMAAHSNRSLETVSTNSSDHTIRPDEPAKRSLSRRTKGWAF